MQVSGQIQSITAGATQTGLARWQVTVNGVTYGTLEDPRANVGDTVAFEASQNGKWFNAKGWVKSNGSPFIGVAPAPPSLPPAPPPFAPPGASSQGFRGSSRPIDPEREPRIVRQNATSSAIALLDIYARANPEHMRDRTLEDALIDVAWIGKKLFAFNMQGYPESK